eukprot:362342-Chlamydomonas_euryale.AAC.12
MHIHEHAPYAHARAPAHRTCVRANPQCDAPCSCIQHLMVAAPWLLQLSQLLTLHVSLIACFKELQAPCSSDPDSDSCFKSHKHIPEFGTLLVNLALTPNLLASLHTSIPKLDALPKL